MKPLNKTLLAVTLTIATIITLDYGVGSICEYAYKQSKYGIFHRQNYCIKNCEDEVLILGSSRAAHHYVPSLLTDSLGLSCYNAGSDGMCIYYHFVLLETMIKNGNCPKIVVYEILSSDIERAKGATFNLESAIDRLAPYYGESAGLDSLIELKSGFERLKFRCKTYRYNSKLVQLIKCNYIPFPEDRGYEAVFGELPKDARLEEIQEDGLEIDEDKLRYIHKLIDLSRQYKFKLIFAQSPYYRKGHTQGEKAIIKVFEQENIPFIDMLNDPGILQSTYFRDNGHLNDEGAHAFTERFIVALQKHLNHHDYADTEI